MNSQVSGVALNALYNDALAAIQNEALLLALWVTVSKALSGTNVLCSIDILTK